MFSVTDALNYDNRFDLFIPSNSHSSIFDGGGNFLEMVKKYPLLWSWLLDLTVPETLQKEILIQSNNTYGMQNNLIKPDPNNDVTVLNNQNKIPPWNMNNVMLFLQANNVIPRNVGNDFFGQLNQMMTNSQQQISFQKNQISELLRENSRLHAKVLQIQSKNMRNIDYTFDQQRKIRSNPTVYKPPTDRMLNLNQPTLSQSKDIAMNNWNNLGKKRE